MAGGVFGFNQFHIGFWHALCNEEVTYRLGTFFRELGIQLGVAARIGKTTDCQFFAFFALLNNIVGQRLGQGCIEVCFSGCEINGQDTVFVLHTTVICIDWRRGTCRL